MNQFDKKHYAFMREWRSSTRERLLPLRKSVSLRPDEPDASSGDWLVGVGVIVILIIAVLAT